MATEKRSALLQGSLDMLILQSLKTGSRHGYSIAKHLKEVSKDFLQVEEGSLYPALHRMEKRGWIASFWGLSESNRKARFYELTTVGKGQLKQETQAWKQMSTAINHVLGFQS
jgi:PadR family transcriptional regulator, regulatory protein PadR